MADKIYFDSPAGVYYDILPYADDTYWLGSATRRFKGLMLSGGAGGYFLAPVLTTAQRDGLTPTAGMVIYNSTTGTLQTYNGAAWVGALSGEYLPLAGGTMTDFILFANAKGLKAGNSDGNILPLQARDSGAGLVEVAALVGAADPYFKATLPMVLALNALPGTPVDGHLAYDVADSRLKLYQSSAWKTLAHTLGTRNLYLPTHTVTGQYQGHNINALPDGVTTTEIFGFRVPDDYGSGLAVKAVLVSVPSDYGDMRHTSSWAAGAVGEAGDTHSEAPAMATINIPNGQQAKIQVASLGLTMTSVAVGDYVSVSFARNGADAGDNIAVTVNLLGLLATYTPS